MRTLHISEREAVWYKGTLGLSTFRSDWNKDQSLKNGLSQPQSSVGEFGLMFCRGSTLCVWARAWWPWLRSIRCLSWCLSRCVPGPGAAPGRRTLVFGRWCWLCVLMETPAGSLWWGRMGIASSHLGCSVHLRPPSPSLMVMSAGRNSVSPGCPLDLWILRVSVPSPVVCCHLVKHLEQYCWVFSLVWLELQIQIL